MKNKNWILILAILIILTGASLFYFKFLSWQTYTNNKYSYKIKYPHGWIMDDEKSLVDKANTIFSIVNTYDIEMKKSISIEVSQNDLTLPLQKDAFKTEMVKIGGISSVAYIFKSEYNECGAKLDEYCAYFLIPLQHNNLWYTLGAGGKLQGVEGEYRRSVSSFKFTDNI
jgi:hypothetical protein